MDKNINNSKNTDIKETGKIPLNKKKMLYIIIGVFCAVVIALIIIILTYNKPSKIDDIVDTDVNYIASEVIYGKKYNFFTYTFDDDISFDIGLSNKFKIIYKEDLEKAKNEIKALITPVKADADNYAELITVFDPEITVKEEDYYKIDTDEKGKTVSLKYYDVQNEYMFVINFD